jgi:hypothetical protein
LILGAIPAVRIRCVYAGGGGCIFAAIVSPEGSERLLCLSKEVLMCS